MCLNISSSKTAPAAIILEDASGLLLLEESGVIPTAARCRRLDVHADRHRIGRRARRPHPGRTDRQDLAPARTGRSKSTLELPADNPDIRATAADGDPNLVVGTRSIKAYRNDTLRANVIVWNLVLRRRRRHTPKSPSPATTPWCSYGAAPPATTPATSATPSSATTPPPATSSKASSRTQPSGAKAAC